jgi:hypothetical protein
MLHQNYYYLKIVCFILSLSGCGDKCYKNYYQNITSYKVSPNVITKSGFKVDTGGINVDIDALDSRLVSIENCLISIIKQTPVITEEQKNEWQCLKKEFEPEPIKRDCLVVKVIEAVLSSCSEWEFIPVLAPDQYCLDKGIIPTPECPCKWRLAVQNDNILITPPALYLWDVTRIYTSCNNIWKSHFLSCLII